MTRMNLSLGGGLDVVNVLDCNIIVSKFEIQLYYYVHFQINTLRKCLNLLILPNFRLNSGNTIILLKG